MVTLTLPADRSRRRSRALVSSHQDLEEEERRILRDVFAATETTLKEVMRPRGDVEFLQGALALTDAAAHVRNLPYSRYPVTGEDFDEVIGFLHVRDLLGVRETDDRSVADVCRPVLMLPGSKLVLPSVATMREEGIHLAVVVDEYGGTDGIVTLEDLVEELVGDIRDEYDTPESSSNGDLSHIDGGTTIEDFAQATGVELEDGNYATVAGYVIARLGHIPVVGEQVGVDGGILQVAAMTGSRITEVAIRPGL